MSTLLTLFIFADPPTFVTIPHLLGCKNSFHSGKTLLKKSPMPSSSSPQAVGDMGCLGIGKNSFSVREVCNSTGERRSMRKKISK